MSVKRNATMERARMKKFLKRTIKSQSLMFRTSS